jgi:hypothetical protein
MQESPIGWFLVQCVTDSDFEVHAGHTRLQVARTLPSSIHAASLRGSGPSMKVSRRVEERVRAFDHCDQSWASAVARGKSQRAEDPASQVPLVDSMRPRPTRTGSRRYRSDRTRDSSMR